MCGIAGIIRFDDRPADVAMLARMSGRVAHRGPDGSGIYAAGPVGLAHRRLSILDTSAAAHQPMWDAERTAAISYNGEVYNYRELRASLAALGHRFESTGDTAVLLAACQTWGVPEAARRVNGMFAFAYWDARRREMWLVRDRVGIKPLYYHCSAERVLFASEIKALLGEVDAQPDENALTALLMRIPLHDPNTPFKGIRAVEGGQAIRFDAAGRVEPRTYFSLADAVDPELYASVDRMSDRDVVSMVDERVRESVALHAASDAPVGTLVSGGVDSGLVSSLAGAHLPGLNAYHADVEGPCSELAWARETAREAGLPLRVLKLTHEGYVRALPQVTYFNEWPVCLHPNTVPFHLVCGLAARRGEKVLLTGEGADELFGGYAIFRAAARRRRLDLWRRRLCSVLGGVGLGRVGRLVEWATRGEGGSAGMRSAAATMLSRGRSLLPVHAAQEAYGFVADPVEREFHADLFGSLHGYLQSILWRNDRMGMAAGVESRVPYLENELIRCALNLPMRFKLRGRTDKWALRRAAERRLPRALSRRPKMGFPVDARTYVRPPAAFFRGGFVEGVMDIGPRQLEALAAHQPDSYFDLMTAELWGRMFFGGEAADALSERLWSAVADTVAPRPLPERRPPIRLAAPIGVNALRPALLAEAA
ncbi:MAG: hypothetical protein JWN40_4311 [Phycisphaerales bacterium]|nr:hypothetical protein [Phycisphaerales bacterium]